MALTYIEVNPKNPAQGTLILLHGLGANGHDFEPLAEELNLPATLPLRFIFPHAPKRAITINQGYVMPGWYDIVAMNIDQADLTGIQSSVASIHALIEQEKRRGIPADRIILAGFSQGAVIALYAGLSYPEKLAGVMGLSGYLPETSHFFEKAHTANQSTPIFLAHGTADTVVPYFLGQAMQQLLVKKNYAVSWHTYPMAHSVCRDEIHDMAKWLVFCFSQNAGNS